MTAAAEELIVLVDDEGQAIGSMPKRLVHHGETPLHGAVYRGGALTLIDFLVARGAKLDVVNDRGFTPVRVADGIARGTAINRYPEAAARLREHLAAQGLPVPPVAPPGNGKE